MAARTPPTFLQASSHTAENTRLALGAPILTGGIVEPGDMLVAAPGGTMTVTVASGQVLVLGSRAYQGVYHCVNDASATLTIAAADATNPRYDRVVAWIQDAAYAGSVNSFSLAVVTGTPAATPLEPAIPADSVELARITVAAGATSIVAGNILDRRVVAVHRGTIFSPDTAADVGLTVKGLASQTGDMTQWVNSAGTRMTYVSAAGQVFVNGLRIDGSDPSFNQIYLSGANDIGVLADRGIQLKLNNAADATGYPVIIRAVNTQTEYLTRWQSTAGATIAGVNGNGNVSSTGSVTVLSDMATKENVSTLPGCNLDIVRRLRPVSFDYIEGETGNVGFVAQEVAEVLPNAVVPFDAEHLGLREGALIAVLVAAVQELAEKVGA